jgi:hypothetical protein
MIFSDKTFKTFGDVRVITGDVAMSDIAFNQNNFNIALLEIIIGQPGIREWKTVGLIAFRNIVYQPVSVFSGTVFPA